MERSRAPEESLSSPSPFAEAPPYYQSRAPYAPAALEYAWDSLDLDRESRAMDLGCGPGTVTIGQAFHWMDRDLVLRKLERMLDRQRGALVLINPGKRRPQESWEPTMDRLVARYLGARSKHPNLNAEAKHEPALLRSAAFSQFTAREFAVEFERDVASIISYVYSLSTSPRSAFGARLALFERELTESLLAKNPSGVFRERAETEVLIARLRAVGQT